MLITGLHTVCDIYCITCNCVLGWKYEVRAQGGAERSSLLPKGVQRLAGHLPVLESIETTWRCLAQRECLLLIGCGSAGW